MSKKLVQIIISVLVACMVVYVVLQQPAFHATLPKENPKSWLVFAFVLFTLCLSMYGYFINNYIVYPIFKTIAPYVSPKKVHDAFFYRALAFYRKYQRGEISLKELAEETLTKACNEEKEAAYVLYALMDMEPEVLVQNLQPETRDLVLTGLTKASKKRLWGGVYLIASLTTAIALTALVVSFPVGKAILLTFAGVLVKHATSRFA